MRTIKALAVFVLFLALATTATADVRLPSIIGSNMVLQQKTKAPIWGWADPGEKVTVKADWQWFPTSTKADRDGKWMVKISTPKASGPYTIEIKASNTIKLENVRTQKVSGNSR